MKALIRHNYYIVKSSLKAGCFLILGAIVFVFFANLFFTPEAIDSIGNVMLFMVMGSLAGLCFTLYFNTDKCKWDCFVLTSGYEKKDIIKARYVSVILFSISICIIFILSLFVTMLVTNRVNVYLINYAIQVAVVLLVINPAFTQLLILKYGVEKGTFLFIVSLVISSVITGAFVLLIALLVKSLEVGIKFEYIITIALILFGIAIYIGSYFLSKKIYNKQDL